MIREGIQDPMKRHSSMIMHGCRFISCHGGGCGCGCRGDGGDDGDGGES